MSLDPDIMNTAVKMLTLRFKEARLGVSVDWTPVIKHERMGVALYATYLNQRNQFHSVRVTLSDQSSELDVRGAMEDIYTTVVRELTKTSYL